MRIAALQTTVFWENPKLNYAHINEHLKKVKDVDLIILPEMFTTGFSMNSNLIAEETNGETLQWMKAIAKDKESIITGSIAVKENDKFFNRLLWVLPNGDFSFYDKRHLFRMAEEDLSYQSGSTRSLFNVNNFQVCPLICYDLRFPVWSRNNSINGKPAYDCLIYIANWPAARVDSWITLLKARAIENQVYVIGINRVGVDGNGVEYCGGSRVFDFKGVRLDEFQDNQEILQLIELNITELDIFRKKFPVILDADHFKII